MVPTRALNDTAVIFSPPGFAVYNTTTTSQPSKDQSRVFNAHPVGGDASSVLMQSKIAVANKQEEEPAVRSSLFGGAGSLSKLRRGYSESSVDVLSKKRDAISGRLKRASVDSCRHITDEKKFFSLPNRLFSWLARKQASRVKNKCECKYFLIYALNIRAIRIGQFFIGQLYRRLIFVIAIGIGPQLTYGLRKLTWGDTYGGVQQFVTQGL